MKSRILMITQNFPPEKGGNASRIYDLSRNLVKLGAEVTIISPHPTFPFTSFKKTWKLYSYIEIDGIKQIRLLNWQPNKINPSFLSRILYYTIFPIYAIIWALIKRKDYDFILTTVPPIFTGITGYFIKKLTDNKWFFDIRDLWVDASVSLGFVKQGSYFEKLSKKLDSLSYRYSDKIFVTTNEMKKILEITNNVSSEKIKIISNGVDTEIFKPSNHKNNRIIYTGNIGHAQELEKVILAIKKVNEIITIEFHIIGEGDLKKELEDLVKKEGLKDIVIFKGLLPREKIPELISESLIGLAPIKSLDSLKYAIPTKAYEYMSCGIPFIVTGKGEVENLVKSSKAGLLAESTVESIYEKILYLLKDKELMKKMGDNGRHFVVKYYDRKKIAEGLLQYMQSEVS